MKQIAFDFSVTAPISNKSIVNLVNSKFCEDFQSWTKEQNQMRNLPKISGVQSIKYTSPRIYTTKNRNNSNLYNSDELRIL